MATALILVLATASLVACGPEPTAQPKLSIEIHGWGPTGAGSDGFVMGLPDFSQASSLRLKVTQPRDQRILSTETFTVGAHKGSLPDVTFGENLRVDLEVLDANLAVVASGATPIFSFEQGDTRRAFRVLVTPTNRFAPVGSLVADRETGANKLVQSRFDYSAITASGASRIWLGRIGQAVAMTDDGQVLIVGGAEPAAFHQPGTTPSLRQTFSDIQIFDPATGYFTDLSFDDQARAVQSTGTDKLRVARAFHTITPLGADRFLVVGGLTLREGGIRALNSMEIIDLKAPAGTRIQELRGDAGPALLTTHRAFHSATLRSSDRKLIVAGGVGHNGATDVIDSFEVIDIARGTITASAPKLNAARTDHSAVLSADGTNIWLIGGRDASGALASTETLRPEGEATVSTVGVRLNRARFGASTVRLSATGGNDVLVIGGFSDTAGAALSSFEIGGFARDAFFQQADWTLKAARGAFTAIELPNSTDVMVIGGVAATSPVASAERLRYKGLADATPFVAETQGSFVENRHGASAVMLQNGHILVLAGVDGGDATAHDNAELFNALDPVRNRAGQ